MQKETLSRYNENDRQAQFDPNSMCKFEMDCYSEWIIIRSLEYGFGVIDWVFLITKKDRSSFKF